MMKKLVFFATFFLLLIGCKNNGQVEIKSEPSDINVYVNGELAGRTPLLFNKEEINKVLVAFDTTYKGIQEKKVTKRKVTTAYLPITAYLPLFVALENGYFEENGLEVEAIESSNPNDIVTGIVANEVDFAVALAYSILLPASIQYPDEFKFFSSSEETMNHFTSSIITKKDSPINSVEDLKGKKIGVYSGLVQKIFLKAMLHGMGINPDDISIVEISPRLQIQGLLSDQYDALSSTEPTTNIAILQDHAKAVVENPRVKYILCPFPSTATTISTDLINDHPSTTESIIKSLEMAIDFINQYPEQARKILPKYTPIPEAARDRILDSLKLFHYCKLGNENRLNVQRFADFLFDEGLLKKKIEDVNTFFGDYEMNCKK